MIEIKSFSNFYTKANEIIINNINKIIESYKNLETISEYIDYFQFIEENHEFLDPEKFFILPDLNGDFKKADELKKKCE